MGSKTMKVWQLASIMRDNENLIEVAAEQPQWQCWGEIYQNFSNLVEIQNREVLDALLATDYVEAVLAKAHQVCYLGTDLRLRSYQAS